MTSQARRTPKPRRARRAVPSTPRPYAVTDGVTQSLLGSWVQCRQAARYYLDGWRQSDTKESLAFGSLWHYLLEGLYEGVRAGKITRDPDCIAAYYRRRVRSWRRKIASWTSAVEAQTAEMILAKAQAIFLPYCEAWVDDFDPALWQELEGVFDVEWRGHRLRGRIDGVRVVKPRRRAPRGGAGRLGLWLLETKTMGRVDSSLEDALTFDFQSLFYLTAAEAALGRPVSGVLYNVVRRPGQKQTKKDRTLGAYSARVRADADKRPDHYFKRFELTFAPRDRERFERELEMKLAAFGAWYGDNGCISALAPSMRATYRNERACRGRWTCDYLDACSSGCMEGFASGGRLFEELE